MRAPKAVLIAAVFSALASPAHADEVPRRHALLIGINEYVSVPDLRGAKNDVSMMRGILSSRFGFRDEDIEVLEDEQATRKGLLDAIERLAERVGPQDVVYLHYSGHGSQVQDQNGDEEDGRDETLIPHDGRTSGIPDITDDELAALLARIDAKQVVVTLDSCHSGTATRGALFMRSRVVAPDTRIELYASGAVAGRAVVPLVQQGHVLLTGAAHNEEALDGPVDGRLQGLFSYALGQALSRADPDVSPRRVFEDVERELERIKGQLGLRNMPSPQLEATDQDLGATLFPAPGAGSGADSPGDEARVAWLAADPGGDGQARLRDGPSLGALPGSVWAIYPPDERAFRPGAALAEATVTRLDGTDAVASLEPKTARIPQASRAIALLPPPTGERVPVRIQDGDTARGQRLREAIQSLLGSVEFVGDGGFARFAVEIDADECRVYAADGLYQIATLPVGSGDEVGRLAASLAALFARSMTVAELLSIENATTEIDLSLDVAGSGAVVSDGEDEDAVQMVADTDAPRYRIRHAGEARNAANSLILELRSSHDCWLTIVDIDSEGTVHLLFPNPLSEAKGYLADGAIPKGDLLRIPDSLESGNRAGFHIDYAPPIGADTVRAFCTLDRGMAVALRAAVSGLAAPPGEAASLESERAEQRSLFGSLRTMFARGASRGMVLVADETEPDAPTAASVESADSEPSPGEASTESGPDEVAAPNEADWAARSLTLEVAE